MYVGVDPGNDGGLSFISEKGKAIEYQRMPDVRGVDRFFNNASRVASSCGQKIVCVFEEHKGGKAGVSSAAAHKSAERYLGMMQMICSVHEIKMICVTPQEWKAYFKLINRTATGAVKPSDKEKREAAKAASIKLCKEYFKGVDLLATPRCSYDHDGMAESLLLAEFGRQKRFT